VARDIAERFVTTDPSGDDEVSSGRTSVQVRLSGACRQPYPPASDEWIIPPILAIDPRRGACEVCREPIQAMLAGERRASRLYLVRPPRTWSDTTYPLSLSNCLDNPNPQRGCEVWKRGGLERADAPDGAGASRDGWSGVRTESTIGREGEPIDDVGMMDAGAKWAKCRSGLPLGPFVLGIETHPSRGRSRVR
jgi:hypothetical protein